LTDFFFKILKNLHTALVHIMKVLVIVSVRIRITNNIKLVYTTNLCVQFTVYSDTKSQV